MIEMNSTVNMEEFTHTKWRVKYYNLNNTGDWNDCGTGNVFITKTFEYQLTIVNELDETIILELCLNSNIQFHLQRNTIITWSNTANNEDDMAISFQDIQGVKEVWEIICQIQGRDPYDITNGLCYENKDILIDVTLENLPLLDNIITNELNAGKIKQINYEIMNNSGIFLHKLAALFFEEEKRMEELKSNCSNRTSDTSLLSYPNDSLSLISNIIKHLLLIADRDLLLMLVTDKYYEFVFGALEFDSISFKVMRHRDYFKSIANFRNILDISDAELISKIQLNHRLTYLRDTAAGRFIEETSFNNINLIIQTNNSNIIRFFISNEKMLTIIISKLSNNDNQIIKDATSFLVELTNCSQNIFQLRIQFLELLCSLGILKATEDLIYSLRNNTKTTQWFNVINVNISQILINLLSFVPSQLKTYIMSTLSNQINNNNNTLLSEITQLLLHQSDFSVQYEIGEIIKTLLDNDIIYHSISSGVESSITENNNNNSNTVTFFEIVLNYCLLPLSEFLISIINDNNNKNELTTTKQIIIEILSYCLSQHGKYSVFWFIENQILFKVLSVLNNKIKILDLQVVKFTKSVILYDNPSLNNEILKTNCLQNILHLFKTNMKIQNIIFSSILELISCIKSSSAYIMFINNIFQSSKNLLYKPENFCYFKELISVFESETKRSCEHNEEPLSFVGLFPSNKEKNEEDDFDLVKDNSPFLGNKRPNNKDINDYFDCSLEKRKL